ncbi:MAG: DMT family transporter, partial [bacterium]|nr:DMT family transporter [bacterium]
VSSFTVLGKVLLNFFEPSTLLVVAYGASALVLMLFFGALPELKKIFLLSKRSFFALLVMSLLASAAAPLLMYQGLKITSATNAILIAPMEFVLTGLVAMIWLRERITSQQLMGIVVMLAGVSAIITRGFSIQLEAANGGDLLVLGATMVWALSNNIFKKYLSHVSPELVVMFRNGLGALVVFILSVFLLGESHDFQSLLSGDALWPMVAFVVVTILLGQTLWFKSLELIPATRASTIALSSPFFAIFYAQIFLDEPLLGYHLVGGTLVIIGLTFTVLHRQRHPDHALHQKVKDLHR